MDGNLSWAKKNKLDMMEGYSAGMRNFVNVILFCKNFGIKYTTFYAFSTENWNRSKSWITSFMNLTMSFYENDPCIKILGEAKIKLVLLGNIAKLDKKMQKILNDLVENTKNNKCINVCLAISYGAKDEIVRACQKISENNLDITEENINKHLDTKGIPDPDIIIRTSGKQRLSNFLLWQASYSELYFTNTLWPDFGKEELQDILIDYGKRERTYGK
jgi:undecaprenyl diphosphate synthase